MKGAFLMLCLIQLIVCLTQFNLAALNVALWIGVALLQFARGEWLEGELHKANVKRFFPDLEPK